MFTTYLCDGLTQLLSTIAPAEHVLSEFERRLLIGIQGRAFIDLSDDRIDQRWQRIAKDHRRPQLSRQTRCGIRERRDRRSSKDVVQKFELEPAAEHFRHHG